MTVKIQHILASLCLTFSLTTAAVAQDQSGEVTATELNVRRGPGVQHKAFTTVKRGQSFEVLETAGNGWHKIKLNSQIGWVSGKYLKVKAVTRRQTGGAAGAISAIGGNKPKAQDQVIREGTVMPRDNTRVDVPMLPPSKVESSPNGKVDLPLGHDCEDAPATQYLADKDAKQDQQYDHYKKLVESYGGKVADRPYARHVIGLRGCAPDGTKISPSKRDPKKYTCTFVVIYKTKTGAKRVQKFLGSTYPSINKPTHSSVDADGDGERDTAHMKCGHYTYTKITRDNGDPAYACKAGKVPVNRDLNHNGVIEYSETKFAVKHSIRASGILFHVGTYKRGGHTSTGCLTLHPDHWSKFRRAFGNDSTWEFTLINAYF